MSGFLPKTVFDRQESVSTAGAAQYFKSHNKIILVRLLLLLIPGTNAIIAAAIAAASFANGYAAQNDTYLHWSAFLVKLVHFQMHILNKT